VSYPVLHLLFLKFCHLAENIESDPYLENAQKNGLKWRWALFNWNDLSREFSVLVGNKNIFESRSIVPTTGLVKSRVYNTHSEFTKRLMLYTHDLFVWV